MKICILLLGLITISVVYATQTDPVIYWNNVLNQVIRNDKDFGGPGWVSRNGALIHIAIYDAVESIFQEYSPYLKRCEDVHCNQNTASVDSAVGQAAHDVLVYLYPKQKHFIDEQLKTFLDELYNYDSQQIAVGIKLGKCVARNTIEWRQCDKADKGDPDTHGGSKYTKAGVWSSDPTQSSPQEPLGEKWGDVYPFAIEHVDYYEVPAPPDLTSQEYTDDFNYVKEIGKKHSNTRTDDETEIGIFWAYDRPGMGPPMILYNQHLQEIAILKENTVYENARLFALVNIAMADAGIACWHYKYKYNLWRPVTAIRYASDDKNPNTIADHDWEPLGSPGGGIIPDFTPRFPSYASGHSTFGGAVYKILELFYGSDECDLDLHSDELPGVTRHYSKFSQASEENAFSRVYLGVHWSFDCTEGVKQGEYIGEHVFKHFLSHGNEGRHAQYMCNYNCAKNKDKYDRDDKHDDKDDRSDRDDKHYGRNNSHSHGGHDHLLFWIWIGVLAFLLILVLAYVASTCYSSAASSRCDVPTPRCKPGCKSHSHREQGWALH